MSAARLPARRAPATTAAGTSGTAAAAQTPRLAARAGRYYIDGRPALLRAAELQYFRVPAEQWRSSLARLREAGCNAIASYIPWSWHEPERGAYDFAGATDPQRDVRRFLELVREAGFLFLARPGPFIYAEYQGFGYPEWLAGTIPQALARRANGRPARASHYQLYSFLHPAYLAEVERWYRTVADALRGFLHDPIAAWQIDNETGLIYAVRIGDLDFNPDTVARYRAFLAEKYESPHLLAERWRRVSRRGRGKMPAFEQIMPPKCQSGPAEMADWQEFLELSAGRYLRRLREIVCDADVDLPLMVNEPAEYLSPSNPRVKAPVADFYGYDSYIKVTGGKHTADFPFASSHHPLRFQQFESPTRPLTCWELGAGWWDWRARVAPAATVQTLGAGLAHGLKGWNVYLAQDGRDPGGFKFRFDGLLDEAGRPTERYEALARLQHFAAAHEEELSASTEVRDPIAYLEYQPYTRLMPEDCLPVAGLIEPLRYFASFSLVGLRAVLSTAGYNAPFVDLQSATEDTLSAFRAAIFPSRGYLDPDSYERLEGFALGGGHLITFPEPVTQEPDGTPLDTARLWPHAPARARWLERHRLIGYLISRWIVPYYASVRRTTARVSPGALHLSDLIEPALVGQGAPLRAAALHCARTMERLGGDFRLLEFAEGGDVLLRHRGASAGYRVSAGRGTSTLLGTIPGGTYTTSRYYSLPVEHRLALRRFAARLLEHQVPRTIVPDDALEVETVARLSPEGGCLLFVINRLGAQAGTVRIANPEALHLGASPGVEVLYSAFGSSATATTGGVSLHLAADDVLVLRLR